MVQLAITAPLCTRNSYRSSTRHLHHRSRPPSPTIRRAQATGPRERSSLPGDSGEAPQNNNGWLNGFSWALGYEWHTVVNSYHHYNTPNKLTCLNPGDPGGLWGGTSGMSTASSNHPGGVNVCFTDGSVRFVKDTVSPANLVGARKP